MMRMFRPVVAATFSAMMLLAVVGPVGAQSAADHLKCFKVKDPQARTFYTADLNVETGTIGGVSEPGCTIILPAVMACVPTGKENVTPTPPGGGGSGTPNSFFCYKVRCPKVARLALDGTDQFGTRTVQETSGSKLLCAPLVGPPTTTTTTTSSTTTTTVPGPSCSPDTPTLTWSVSGSVAPVPGQTGGNFSCTVTAANPFCGGSSPGMTFTVDASTVPASFVVEFSPFTGSSPACPPPLNACTNSATTAKPIAAMGNGYAASGSFNIYLPSCSCCGGLVPMMTFSFSATATCP